MFTLANWNNVNSQQTPMLTFIHLRMMVLCLTNYAKWIPVHLHDLNSQNTIHLEYYDYFQRGKFVVQKTTRTFSAIAIDQAHKQNNAIVKGNCGAVGLAENASALQHWMVSGPEMARIIEEFQASTDKVGTAIDTGNQEESTPVQITIAQDVQSLTDIIEQMGNPFTENISDLIILDTRDIADPTINVCARLRNSEQIGMSSMSRNDWWKKQRILTSQLKETNLPYFASMLPSC